MRRYRCAVSVSLTIFFSVALIGGTAPVIADDLRVPEDYPSIQAAIDAANPAGGDTILVGPGDYAGAVITNPVRIVGSGPQTRIVSGTPWDSFDAFDLYGPWFEADGTEISDLVIDYDGLGFGIWSSGVDNVTISNVKINRPEFFGILVMYGSGWVIDGNEINNANRAIDLRFETDNNTIVHNKIIGLRPSSFLSINHIDGISVAEGSHNVVAHNHIYHVENAVGGFEEELYVGIAIISLGGGATEKNNIHNNRIEISVPDTEDFCGAIVLVDYGFIGGLPVTIIGNKVTHNDMCGSCSGLTINPEEIAYLNTVKHNECLE